MPVTQQNINDVVRYHAPTLEQIYAIGQVREATENLILTILTSAPPCADQQAAIRHAREALMTANAAIVLEGKV